MHRSLDSRKFKETHYETTEFEWVIRDFISRNQYKNFHLIESPSFTFVEEKWKLLLYDVDPFQCNFDFMCLLLKNCKGVVQDVKFKCSFGLKKADGTVEYFPVNCEDETFYTYFDRDKVLRRRHELVPSNIMTIMCILKLETDESVKQHSTCATAHHPASPEAVDPLKCIKLDTLSDNFKSLFADKASCDVTFSVKEEEFKAHKAVLVARCPVFASMFHHDTSENQTGIINIPDCDPKSFHQFLEYLYCGKLEDVSFPNVLHLYSISDKYNVQELKTFCAEYMKLCLAEDNVCDVVILADRYDETRLLSAAQEYFIKNANKVVTTTKWEGLLKDNYRLANKLIIEMASKMKI